MIKDRKEKLKKKIPFTTATKHIKYLRINLPKKANDMYSENYKTLMKEIKNYTKGKIYHVLGISWYIPCSWVGRIHLVKMIILPKAIYRVSAISTKLPKAFFT